jgi:hypothetical protein
VSKSEDDLRASLDVMAASIGNYRTGVTASYRVVATELRKLLCDRNPLLPRIRPRLRLHKLHWTQVLEGCPTLADGLEVMMPGRLCVSASGDSYFELLFAKSTELMAVEDWIQQPFFSPSITVRDLIKSVADKEGAHSDPDFNETLIRSKLVKYAHNESHMIAVIAIGEYLLKWIRDSGALPAYNRLQPTAAEAKMSRRG